MCTKKVYTRTGSRLYSWFSCPQIQGMISTDPNEIYGLPDGTTYSRTNEIEDWIIRTAEQIKSERQQIIINNVIK